MTYQKLIYHLGIFILLLSACSNQTDREDKDTAGYIPQAPDYADPNLWYTRENNQVEQGADVFYIVSTWEKDWNFDMNIPYTAGPDEFVCQVTAKPKADMPAIEENASYLLEENIQVRVNGILEDGTMSSEYGYSGNRSGTETKSSEGMKKYVTGEHSLMKFTYTPEK